MAYRNAPLHPILKLIYLWLRFTTWAGTSVFYRRRLVIGRENLHFDGPAVVVCNHPSTLMDPLNVGLNIRQEMFFLANYGLFKNPVSSWILTRLFCIPVKRKEDVAEGEARDNDAAFEQSFQHLEKNGVLFIAAEGVSWMNRYVRPFKTGTARIALGTERRNNWQLGVKIIPVGVSYDAPRLFRSRTAVEYGAPILAARWAEAYQNDPEKAVDDFTVEIQRAVAACTLNSGSEVGDVFMDQTETMLRNHASGLSAKETHLQLKAFLQQNIDNEALKAQVADYFKRLELAEITDAGLSKPVAPFTWLWLLLLSPFFLLGYGFWFLPCWLPFLLCKKMNIYPGYDSNIKMLAGLFTFPLALWGGWKLAFWLFGSSLWAWAGLLILILCGYLAEAFMDIYSAWKALHAADRFKQQHPQEYSNLWAQREAILKFLSKVPPNQP